ncbi:MAG: transglycosylase family protein [Acidimicrobiales bacterium]
MRRMIYAVLVLFASAAILASSASAEAPLTNAATSRAVSAQHHRAVVRARAIAARTSLLGDVAAQARLTIDQLRREWQLVAICEVGGNWAMNGSSYSGIGFANSTWLQYGGSRFAPLAGQAPRDAQILIGMKVTGGWVPDQQGCSPGGW